MAVEIFQLGHNEPIYFFQQLNFNACLLIGLHVWKYLLLWNCRPVVHVVHIYIGFAPQLMTITSNLKLIGVLCSQLNIEALYNISHRLQTPSCIHSSMSNLIRELTGS